MRPMHMRCSLVHGEPGCSGWNAHVGGRMPVHRMPGPVFGLNAGPQNRLMSVERREMCVNNDGT